MTSEKKPQIDLIGSKTKFLPQAGELVRKHTQQISQEFLDDLKENRNQSNKAPAGEMHRVASIPVAVVEKWQREGFDVFKEAPPAIIKRLKSENLDMFMATEKRM
jgi:hypothetical protein